MRAILFYILTLCCVGLLMGQTKVGGIVQDQFGEPVAFANVVFQGSSEGTITNDDGRFYMESDAEYQMLLVSFVGYQTQEVALEGRVNLGLEIVLQEGEQLDEVVVYTGKQPKKNNPAIEILKKVWAKKRENGLNMFQQYKYDKYEKVEFDLNSIDSSVINSRVFKGLEFIFDDMDTSRLTGKNYLPVFINETATQMYGDNNLGLQREVVDGVRNSGFNGNQAIIAYVKDLYPEYDIYENHLKFFDKSFTSPISRTGINTYNYVLADSAYVDNKWCYNIIYYPRRKNELTFKGDFWVSDTTFAVKKINMEATRSANLNWVREIYIEQEFEVLNDSVFLPKRDYMLSDFSFRDKEGSGGMYGKRTTVYDNYEFDKEQPKSFYKAVNNPYSPATMDRDDLFWEGRRLEPLTDQQQGIYKMLDTLQTIPRYNTYYDIAAALTSGYIEIDKWNIDLGDIYSSIGFNDAEGVRLRGGARTYFGQNDPWRLEGYMAYGFKDKKFKYGIQGKVLLDPKSRLTLTAGNRRDVEQLGISLTATNDVMGRSIASSSLITVGDNDRLTDINLSILGLELEPTPNFRFGGGAKFRTLKSALPDAYNMDYVDPESPTGVSSEIKQFDLVAMAVFTPGRKTIGYGVEPRTINDDYGTFLVYYTQGIKGIANSDFDYTKLQFSYTHPWLTGGYGRLLTSVEAGKTFGTVPMPLLDVVPGNQTYFTIYNSFPNLDFYEFVTDTYVSMHLEHNFNGRLFSRIPVVRDWNLREIVGLRGVWGELSAANKALNVPTNIPLEAPTDKVYYEYSFGIGNIFKIFRIDFNFRGNYLDSPNARKFGVTGAFGFQF